MSWANPPSAWWSFVSSNVQKRPLGRGHPVSPIPCASVRARTRFHTGPGGCVEVHAGTSASVPEVELMARASRPFGGAVLLLPLVRLAWGGLLWALGGSSRGGGGGTASCRVCADSRPLGSASSPVSAWATGECGWSAMTEGGLREKAVRLCHRNSACSCSTARQLALPDAGSPLVSSPSGHV